MSIEGLIRPLIVISQVCGDSMGVKVDLKQYNITCFNSLVLNVVFSATYSLESHNAITIHFISQNLVNKRENWLFGLYRTSTSLLGKKFH